MCFVNGMSFLLVSLRLSDAGACCRLRARWSRDIAIGNCYVKSPVRRCFPANGDTFEQS